MQRVRSDDAEIAFEIRGSGPPVVLLHPFPCDHEFWLPVVAALESRYKLILPDLRGHGESEAGDGPALMGRHADDVARVMDAAGVGKAAMLGCSIGGYILFEFWRRFRMRVESIVLCCTRPQADTSEEQANRTRNAAVVLEQGTEPFLSTMIPKLMGRTTLESRPDLVAGARQMMRKMSAEDINLVLRGMGERPDSRGDLGSISVPTLIVMGAEDVISSAGDGELMRQSIAGARLRTIPKAGHYAPWEQPQATGEIIRQFLDEVGGK